MFPREFVVADEARGPMRVYLIELRSLKGLSGAPVYIRHRSDLEACVFGSHAPKYGRKRPAHVLIQCDDTDERACYRIVAPRKADLASTPADRIATPVTSVTSGQPGDEASFVPTTTAGRGIY